VLVLATYRDGVYNLLLFLHIVTVIVAFAPAVIHPLMTNQLKSDPSARAAFMRYAHENGRKIYGIAIVLVGLFGIGMIGASDKVIEFSDGWVSAAFLIWIVMVGVLHGVLLPAEKKLAEGDQSMEARVQQVGMALTVLLLIMLYLMIWKPGA
jgi:uncharacterized membrane protein